MCLEAAQGCLSMVVQVLQVVQVVQVLQVSLPLLNGLSHGTLAVEAAAVVVGREHDVA